MPPAADPPALFLRGGLVCDGSAPPRAATVVVGPPRITAVLPPDAPASAIPPGAIPLDATGHLLTPGLIDAHTHLLSTPGDDPDGEYDNTLLRVSLPLRTLRGAANARGVLDAFPLRGAPDDVRAALLAGPPAMVLRGGRIVRGGLVGPPPA